MSPGQADTTLRYIRGLVTTGRARQVPDRELLQNFVSRRDEAAFAALLRRHGPMVHGVCRRVLRNEADAEDAFQAAFLVLARKAAAVRRQESVGSWLYGVAYRVALKARVSAGRRRLREGLADTRRVADPLDDITVREAQALLDEELARLPEKYRAPLVLCCLQGLTRDEAGRQLGWPVGLVKSRIEQARQRLHARLAARGLALTAALAALTLGEQGAAAAVPGALLQATARAAVSFASGGAAAPARVAALAQQVARPVLPGRLTFAALALLAVGVGGAGLAGRGESADKTAAGQTAAPAAVAPRPAEAPKPAARAPARDTARELLKEALKEISDAEGQHRNRALAEIAVLQTRLGDREAARETFRKARALVEELGDEAKVWEVRELARAFARAGEAGEAEALANAIPVSVANFRGKDGGFRDMVLQECATALAEARYGEDALRLADAIADKAAHAWVRPMVLTKLALAQAKAGQIRKALRTADAIKDTQARVQALAGYVYSNPTFSERPDEPGVALRQAEAGDPAGARQTLEKTAALARGLDEGKGRGPALAAVASAWARLGDLAKARDLVKAVNAGQWRDISLATLARAQAAAGRAKAAARTVEQIPDPGRRVEGLCQLGMGLARAGDRKAADAALQQAYGEVLGLPEQERELHMHLVASARAIAGDYADALKLVKLRLPLNATVTYSNIAYEQAKAGHFKEALKTANDHLGGNDFWYGNTVQGIARLQAERDGVAAALAWARRLTWARARGQALLGTAEGLVERTGKHNR
jgi:RNA polymerase sigma factor (sigma-70 family)